MTRVWLYTFSLTRARLEGLFPNPANQNFLRVVSTNPPPLSDAPATIRAAMAAADDSTAVCRECGMTRSCEQGSWVPGVDLRHHVRQLVAVLLTCLDSTGATRSDNGPRQPSRGAP